MNKSFCFLPPTSPGPGGNCLGLRLCGKDGLLERHHRASNQQGQSQWRRRQPHHHQRFQWFIKHQEGLGFQERSWSKCPSHLMYLDVESPEGIAIDHVARLLFWTDSMRDTVEVSKLDGSNRRVLFDTDLVNPRAIVANPVYGWVSHRVGSIPKTCTCGNWDRRYIRMFVI